MQPLLELDIEDLKSVISRLELEIRVLKACESHMGMERARTRLHYLNLLLAVASEHVAGKESVTQSLDQNMNPISDEAQLGAKHVIAKCAVPCFECRRPAEYRVMWSDRDLACCPDHLDKAKWSAANDHDYDCTDDPHIRRIALRSVADVLSDFSPASGFYIGQEVKPVNGDCYGDGIVRATFTTGAGEHRLVVEHSVTDHQGQSTFLRIYSQADLESCE